MTEILDLAPTDNGSDSLVKIETNFSNLNAGKEEVGVAYTKAESDTLFVENSQIDTDGTLAANSDTKIPSQKAVKSYADTKALNTEFESGWIESEPASFVSADGSTCVFNIASDVTQKYSPGMRYKYTQSQALSHYWTFNTNSTPDVGSATMANIGTPTYTAGKFGNALTLNGTNQALSITDAAAFKPTGEFTIFGWVKVPTSATARAIFQSFSKNTNSAGIYLNVIGTTNNLRLEIAKNTGTTLGTDMLRFDGTTNISDGNWHYVVVSYRNNFVQVYLDGNLETSGYSFAPAYAATNYVRIGAYNESGANSLWNNGQIDDFGIINGYALDEATIKAKYLAGTAQGTGNITIEKKALITNVAPYAAGVTPITIWGGTDYSTANATISSPYYSSMAAPFGFDKDENKWKVEFSNSVDNIQASPTASTWYNVGSMSISIPVGKWRVWYKASVYCYKATTTEINVSVTLSSTNNSDSDSDMRCRSSVQGASGQIEVDATLCSEKIYNFTAKVTRYMNCMTSTAGTNAVGIVGNLNSKTIIRAVSSLL